MSLTLLLTFLFQGSAEAQIFKNKLKRENQELRARVDSLKKALTELKEASQHKDSIADEMIEVYEENTVRTAAGLSPEDYTQEVTDSLLSIWYLHRQARQNEEGTG